MYPRGEGPARAVLIQSSRAAWDPSKGDLRRCGTARGPGRSPPRGPPSGARRSEEKKWGSGGGAAASSEQEEERYRDGADHQAGDLRARQEERLVGGEAEPAGEGGGGE